MSAAVSIPVCDLDCEGAVISAVLLDPARFDDVTEIICRPEDFYSDANRRIWQSIIELDAAGVAIDVSTVAARLRETKRLEQVGGTKYLAQLSDGTPSVSHVEAHARIVADRATQRRVVAVCQRYAAEGYGDVGPVASWVQSVERDVYEAAEARQSREGPAPYSELVPRVVHAVTDRRASGGGVSGRDTGWRDLTRALNGWADSQLYVVGGRPGMAKTSFALQAAQNVAASGDLAVFVSCEMPQVQLAERSIAAEARVNSRKIAAAQLSDDDWNRCLVAAERLRQLPVMIAYRPGASIAEVRSIVRRQLAIYRRTNETGRLGMIVVDYLQIMGGERVRGDSRENEVTALSQGLMRLAGEFGCPVLCCSQLNRSVEKRENKRPQLSDLRESGAIEQDAYAVLFLYREEYYEPNTPKLCELEIGIAKNRNGGTGTVGLHFAKESTRITDLARDEARSYDAFDDLTDDFAERYP